MIGFDFVLIYERALSAHCISQAILFCLASLTISNSEKSSVFAFCVFEFQCLSTQSGVIQQAQDFDWILSISSFEHDM